VRRSERQENLERESNEQVSLFKAVKNGEEQYSILPKNQENPLGWFDAGKEGSRQEVLEFIEANWTDMRPLSLRQSMDIRGDSSPHQ
jgi:MbtH protein